MRGLSMDLHPHKAILHQQSACLITGSPIRLSLQNHPSILSMEWVSWRCEKLTTFMAKLYQEVKLQKSSLIVSSAPSV